MTKPQQQNTTNPASVNATLTPEERRREGQDSDKISESDKSLARWLIKQHQRMIHEIRERYGLTE
jgi:hypothetical protein